MTGDAAMTDLEHWWQRAVIYQVYPRSFQDSNGDGIGDLAGIASRLDHLHGLGVDTVWLSPIYPSPMADFGYDVADYVNVAPVFGTLADFDALVAALHGRGMRLVLDYVPNHSSDRHPWFVESRASRRNPKRDWYVWHDPAPGGGPPNNWLSHFGGIAWEWDEPTGQYYLHSFLKEQPDLNWRNPEVRQAMFDVLRFWLERGVDGFRVDVMWCMVKDALFRDNPPNPAWRPGMSTRDKLIPLYDADRPETMELVTQMRTLLEGYGDRLLIGEIYLPVERLVAYYGPDGRGGAQMPYNFTLIKAEWTADSIAATIRRYEAALPHPAPPDVAWPNWVLSNHDQPRVGTRIGTAQARVAAMLLLTLRGTPTIYYGEEIGMVDVAIPPALVQDPAEKRQPGIGQGRDPERTPMVWDASEHGGFTSGVPWLPLGADRASVNVASEAADPRSMLSLYRALLLLRRREPALRGGAIGAVRAEGGVLRFERGEGAGRIAVALNMTGEVVEVAAKGQRIALSTYLDKPKKSFSSNLTLRPNEGVILVRMM